MIFNAWHAYEKTKVDPVRAEMCSKAALTPSGHFAGKAARKEMKRAVKEAKRVQKSGDRCVITHWDNIENDVVPDWDFFQALMLRRGFVVDYLDRVHDDEVERYDKKTGKTFSVRCQRRTYRMKW